MGRSWWFLKFLLPLLLVLSFSLPHGFSRKSIETVEFEESASQLQQEFADTSREMVEIMDYKDPGPNTNPKTGYVLSPPSQG